YIAALIARLTSAPNTAHITALAPAQTIGLYGDVFAQIAVTAAIVGGVLLLITPRLRVWMCL
ncbi:MAG: hypothetical protein M3329_09260, partial [Pseudomonadota bacterium]|nr:hypothetical protein [Pseudomonadota bacterium]